MTFTKHGVAARNPEEGTSYGGKVIDAFICAENEMKLTWMRDTRISLFIQIELIMVCRDESDWLIKRYHYAVKDCQEHYCPPMPPPVPPDYYKTCVRKAKLQ